MTPKFIIEEPANSDELDGHARVARALAEAIKSEKRLRYLGILGRWGSGKSTVVRMLEGQLREEDQTWLFFTYDAWAHQSDPPRRSFLERLKLFIESNILGAKEDESNAEWRRDIDRLAESSETNTTKTTPELTSAAKWIIPSIIFMPIGIRLIGEGVFDGTFSITAAAFFFTLGWALCALPIAIAVGFWARARLRGEDFSPLAVIANKVVETKHEVKTKNAEPTSIEFQRILNDVIKCCSRSNKRLLIVIDNLDRLPPPAAIDLWSTVRGMFLGADSADRNGDAPLVVVPVDEGVVSAVYERGASAGGNVGQGFLDKTFDLVFRIPPPVQSNWQKYALAKFKEVFVDYYTDVAIDNTIAVVDNHVRDSPELPITPRWIIKLVNSLATLHMQWANDKIPLPAMAYFHLNQNVIDSGILEFISRETPFLDDLDDELSKHLAAMHYGVAPAHALQVLLDNKTRAAIRGLDGPALRELAVVPGFGSYLNRLLRGVREGHEQLSPIALVSLVGKLEPAPWQEQSWSLLAGILTKPPYDSEAGQDFVPAIEGLIENLPDSASRDLIEREWQRLEKRAENTKAELAGPFSQLLELLRKHSALRAIDLAPVGIKDPSLFEQLASFGLEDEQWRLINFTGDTGALGSVLKKRLESDLAAINAPEAIKVVASKCPTGVDWEGVTASARQAVESGDSIRAPAGLAGLINLWGISESAVSELKTLHGNGVLQARLSEAISQKLPAQLGGLISVFVKLGEGPGLPGDWSTTVPFVDSDVEAVATILNAAGGPAPATFVSSYEKQPLLQDLLRKLLRAQLSSGSALDFDATDVIQRAGAYSALLDGTLGDALRIHLLGDQEFWDRISVKQVPAVAELFHGKVSETVPADEVADRILALADRLGQPWIKSIVMSGGTNFDMVLAASRVGGAAPSIHEALRVLGDEALLTNGEAGFRRRWFQLVGACAPDTAKTIVTTLLDRLASGSPVVEPSKLIDFGGDSIRRLIKPRHHDGLVRHLLQPLISEDAGREWILANLELGSKWVRGSKPGSISAMRDQLKSLGAAGQPLVALLPKG